MGERLPKLGRVDSLEVGGLYLLERWSAIAYLYSSAYDIKGRVSGESKNVGGARACYGGCLSELMRASQ